MEALLSIVVLLLALGGLYYYVNKRRIRDSIKPWVPEEPRVPPDETNK